MTYQFQRLAPALIFILLMASCAGERSSNLERLVHEYIDACNLHDLETLRGMLTTTWCGIWEQIHWWEKTKSSDLWRMTKP